MQNPTPTSDERVLAALSHFFGPLIALVVWVTQKDKSEFVRFQSVQAMAFGGLVMLVSLVLSMLMFLALSLVAGISIFSIASSASAGGDASEVVLPLFALPALLPLGIFLCLVPFSLAVWIVRLIAAVRVFQGHDHRYPWLGRQVERFLADS